MRAPTAWMTCCGGSIAQQVVIRLLSLEAAPPAAVRLVAIDEATRLEALLRLHLGELNVSFAEVPMPEPFTSMLLSEYGSHRIVFASGLGAAGRVMDLLHLFGHAALYDCGFGSGHEIVYETADRGCLPTAAQWEERLADMWVLALLASLQHGSRNHGGALFQGLTRVLGEAGFFLRAEHLKLLKTDTAEEQFVELFEEMSSARDRRPLRPEDLTPVPEEALTELAVASQELLVQYDQMTRELSAKNQRIAELEAQCADSEPAASGAPRMTSSDDLERALWPGWMTTQAAEQRKRQRTYTKQFH
jgi:hypothetical protein